jgi:hypothetical protein
MTQTVRRQKRNGNVQQQQWGVKAALADRRRAVWALRARGFSYRGIAEQLNLSHPSVAWNDCQRAEEEWGSIIDDPEVVRQQLLAVHTQVVGSLMQCLEKQAQQGQVTEARDADGQTVGYQVRHWISPQSAAEVGRSLQRIAALFGLGNATDPDQAAAATSTTNVVLVQPGDAASFQQRSQELAAARHEAAITVEPAHSEPEAATQPEAASEPLEPQEQPEPQEPPMVGWRAKRAARKAAEAASGRPAVRFLDPAKRN